MSESKWEWVQRSWPWLISHLLDITVILAVLVFVFVFPGLPRVDALAPYQWPLAILLVAILLRAPLAQLLAATASWITNRMQKAEFFGIKLDGPAAATESGRPDPSSFQSNPNGSMVLRVLWKYQQSVRQGY